MNKQKSAKICSGFEVPDLLVKKKASDRTKKK